MRTRNLVAALVGALAVATPSLVPSAPAAADDWPVRDIVFPVAGEVYYTDTWGAPRSGGRTHEGVDMMGEKMVPLVAVVDGTVSWMRFDNGSSSGNILTLTDDEGWMYHYVHINNDTPGTDDGAASFEQAFAPGIDRGVEVTAGQLVAYLGDSGNAEWTAPQLHFEIERPDGTNINPYPSVLASEVGRLSAPADGVDPTEIDAGPFGTAADLADLIVERLWGADANPSSRQLIAERLDDGADLVEVVAEEIDADVPMAQVDRLYRSFFLRSPDRDGLAYWLSESNDGTTLEWIAEYFAQSDEFELRYGGTSFDAFLDQLYLAVLDRDPDEEGKAYWLELLEAGEVNRGTIVVYFSESDELRGITQVRTEAVAVFLLLEDRMPTDDEIEAWVAARDAAPLADVLDAHLG